MTQPEEIDLLAASLRADAADLDVYARVLTTSLSAALPEGMVQIDRDQSLRDRLAGRPGTVCAIRVLLGETTLELAGGPGVPTARIARVVRGVTISNRDVDLTEWAKHLATALAERAKESSAARAALAGLLGS